MAGRLPTAWVDEVVGRADIVDVVSAYLPLKRAGRNFVGLCPFHSEKTPSFSVNRENNVYHCFGCKAGGNVAQFVMEMERLSFPDAVLHLARQLNISPPIEEYNPQRERERSRRERIYQINREAAQLYHDTLFTPEGKAALDYLHRRGIDDPLIRRFGLGASSDAWSVLLDRMLEKGFKAEELVLAGLVHARENHHYDVFRNRVMFPIIDQYGNTLGFGARALGDAQPKYLNTQDTPAFNKRNSVYGINFLRNQRDLSRIILAEGYMDVIALSQYGVSGAVATLGTALTAEQARLMRRYAPQVWIAYDGDEAGQMAAMRALDIFERENIPAKVLRFPDGLDPDDLLRQRGAEAMEAVPALSAGEFRLARLKMGYDLGKPEQVSDYAAEACDQVIAPVEDPIEREDLLRRLAAETGYEKAILAERTDMARSKRKGAQARPPAIRPRPRRQGNGISADSMAERSLLSLLASGYLPEGLIKAEDFECEPLRAFAEQLLDGRSPAQILSDCEDEASKSLASELFSAQMEIDRESALSAAENCLLTLRRQRLDFRITTMKRDLSLMDGSQYLQALKDIQELTLELKGLKLTSRTGKDEEVN